MNRPYSNRNTLGSNAHYMAESFYQRATWKLKFAWLPVKCDLYEKVLWLCWVYEGTACWTGPGDPVYEHRWHDKNEHLIWMLKR